MPRQHGTRQHGTRQHGTHRLAFGAVALAGLVLVGIAMITGARSAPQPTDAGQVPSAVSSQRTHRTDVSPRSRPVLVRPSSGTAPAATRSEVSTRPGVVHSRADPVPQHPGLPDARPNSLSLPSLDVSATILPVRSVAGVLDVPEDPAVVGWWQDSARIGSSSGTVVLDGHIDSATRGIGALFHLGRLAPGDVVRVGSATGAVVTYTVQARRVYPKAAGLPAEVFAGSGPPRLVLISCGGSFDEQRRSYDDNIVVYATPAG